MRADGEKFDCAVGVVANPACYGELVGFRFDKPSEADALDSSTNNETSGLITGCGHLLELFTTEDAEVRRGKSGNAKSKS